MDSFSPMQANGDNHRVNRSRGLSKLGHHNVIHRDSVTRNVIRPEQPGINSETFALLFNNLHLVVSAVIVVPTAVIYGFAPSWLLPQILDFPNSTIDQCNLLRAIMCLYLGVSFIWIKGAIQPDFWTVATQLNVLFMASLGIGRIISMMLDGMPSAGYVFACVAEITLAAYATIQLRNRKIQDDLSLESQPTLVHIRG